MNYNLEAKEIWEEYLRKIDIEFSGYIPKIEKNTDYYAVIIEPRKHQDLLLCMRNVMYHLNHNNSKIKWGLQIFHGNTNKDFVQNCVRKWKNVILTNIGVDNLSNIEHSEYMESIEFWNQVKGEKVLIFQTDSVLLKHGIEEFLSYDYIGAPWRKPKENQLVGNGGLSLRSVKKMIEICNNNKPQEQIWEDIFFIKHMKGEKVADYDTALKFSMEDVFYNDPLGVHNPIRHIDPQLLKSVLFK